METARQRRSEIPPIVVKSILDTATEVVILYRVRLFLNFLVGYSNETATAAGWLVVAGEISCTTLHSWRMEASWWRKTHVRLKE